jgi:hypothetical protein
MRKLPKGHKSVYDPTFKYTSASRTDIANPSMPDYAKEALGCGK